MSGLGDLVVSGLDFQAGYRGLESRSGRDNFQIISTPSSYSTCPGLSIKWIERRLVTDSGTKCACVIHESKAVQIQEHNNRRCLYVPRMPGRVKNPHNNNLIHGMFFVSKGNFLDVYYAHWETDRRNVPKPLSHDVAKWIERQCPEMYSEPSLQWQHLFPKTFPLKQICRCTEYLMSRLICNKGLVLFLFPHRTSVLYIC